MSSIETFFSAWSEADAAKRSALISSAVEAGVVYADPRTGGPLTGTDVISDYVGRFSEQAPGATATVIKSDACAGVARVTVEFKMPDGNAQYGQYFVQPSGDAPIQRMVGFVGTGAPA